MISQLNGFLSFSQKYFHDGWSTEFVFLINGLFYFAAESYVSCYFITQITDDSSVVGEIVYDLHWYKLPTAKQWITQRIIHRAQEPFVFKGLGIIYYSLATFGKVEHLLSSVLVNFVR